MYVGRFVCINDDIIKVLFKLLLNRLFDILGENVAQMLPT